MKAHGHLNLLDEHESCTDLKCPCGELGMSQDEIDLLDNVVKGYPVIVEFQADAADQPPLLGDEAGDVVLIWEWDCLELGWTDLRTTRKAALWYQRGSIREPRIVRREAPQMSKNRKKEEP